MSTEPGRTKVGLKPLELGLTKSKQTGQDTLAFGLWSTHCGVPRKATISPQWAQGHGTALARVFFKIFLNSIKHWMVWVGGWTERESNCTSV